VRLSSAAFLNRARSQSAQPNSFPASSLRFGFWDFVGIWILGFGICLITSSARAADKITYQDNILPLVEANCSKCHNADKKKADLDLTSYQGVLKGSGSGLVVLSGNVDGSKLWKALTHSEEPYMPPNRPKLDDKDLDLIKKWIAGGLLENAGGKAVASAGPAVDLTLKADSIGKPEGPPPMPNELPVEPAVHTPRLNAITGLACSPWAPLAAIAGQKQVLLYNTESLALAGILPFNDPPKSEAGSKGGSASTALAREAEPVDLKFSRNGKLLLAAGGFGAKAGRVLVWDVTTGERFLTIGGEYDTILTSDIRPDQSQIAYGGPSRLVKIYSTKTGEIQHKIKKHTDWVTAVAFSPNGEMLASADRNGGISIWDPENAQELYTLPGHKSAVTFLCWRGDSKLLASSSEDGTVKLWEMKEGKQAKSWNAHASGAMCVSYSHDGKFVTCGRDNSVVFWDANGGKTRTMTGSEDLPLRVAFTSDGERIVATDFSGHVNVWTSKDGKLCGALDANPLPLADQLAAAQKRVKELETAIKAAGTNKTDPTNTTALSEKSSTNTVGTNVVTAASPPKTNTAMTATGANANATNTNSPAPTNTVDVSALEKHLAEAKATVTRLEAAQLLSSAYSLRETLAVKKREQSAKEPAPKKLTAEITADQSKLDQLLQKYHSLLSGLASAK
jgi:WD40 repeat protein